MPDATFSTTDDGVRLHYRDVGVGPAIVLVGGFTARLSSWGLLERELLAQGYRVVSVDRRCHGDSDFPAHGQRIARHAADLEHLRSELHLDGAVWVGSSMGASVLLAQADLFGCAATGGLVLVDQTPKMINDASWDLGMYDLTWEALAAFIAEFPATRSAFHAPPPPEVLQMLMADPGAPYPFDQTRALLLDHAVQDWRDVVGRLATPLLAVAGLHSPLWSADSSRWIAEHAPAGQLAVLDGSGHAPHLSEPELFAKTVLTWLAEL